MRTKVNGTNVTTALTKADRAKLCRLLERLGPHAKVPRLGTYKKLTGDDIWLDMVGQVCVMGSARGMERILSDPGLRQGFTRSTSLTAWKKHGFEPEYMAGVLREHRATRFNVEAAKKLRGLVDGRGPSTARRSSCWTTSPGARIPMWFGTS